jgi:hypothetical protein
MCAKSNTVTDAGVAMTSSPYQEAATAKVLGNKAFLIKVGGASCGELPSSQTLKDIEGIEHRRTSKDARIGQPQSRYDQETSSIITSFMLVKLNP